MYRVDEREKGGSEKEREEGSRKKGDEVKMQSEIETSMRDATNTVRQKRQHMVRDTEKGGIFGDGVEKKCLVTYMNQIVRPRRTAWKKSTISLKNRVKICFSFVVEKKTLSTWKKLFVNPLAILNELSFRVSRTRKNTVRSAIVQHGDRK